MQSFQLMNSTTIVFYYVRPFLPSLLDEFLQIVYGNEISILEQPNSIGHCISADAQMSKSFAQFMPERVPTTKENL